MNDLINRQDAIDALNKEKINRPLFSDRWVILDCLNDIVNLPTVQPERKIGHWIPVTNGRGGHECDKCHNYAPSYQCGGEYLSDFCPNCGSPMEVGYEQN